MLIDEFKKEVAQAVEDYLFQAYKVKDLNDLNKVEEARSKPCIEITRTIDRDIPAEDMKRLIRHVLDNLLDTGRIKTGRSRLRVLVNNVVNADRYSDYEFLREENAVLRSENTKLRKLIEKKPHFQKGLFSSSFKRLSSEVKTSLIKHDVFEDNGEFASKSF